MQKKDFGDAFVWGVSSAAFQTEGAYRADGKGYSIWDKFTEKKGKIYRNQHARVACDFYHRYPEDLQLMRKLGIRHFRFSISWPRILPQGIGSINQAGLDYYKKLIDQCLDLGITPWITLYHWDLPLALEEKGGWTHRDIVQWFTQYVDCVSRALGDRVQYWMVLNEPMVFTGAGYFLGIHAPGKRGMKSFLPSVHHASLCQAEGGRVLRYNCPKAKIGTTFSCSLVEPYKQRMRDLRGAERVDALLNRLFIEPSLGMGYPLDKLPKLGQLERYMQDGDESRLVFDFDFYGLQNYTREIIRHAWLMPYIRARPIAATKRQVPFTLMDWEVYPPAIYGVLKQFYERYQLKKIIITENGAAFEDQVRDGRVQDPRRVDFLQQYIAQCLRAKQEGVPLEGYFVWTFTDNFEWAEGYKPTFGLIHVDFTTQQRTPKDSALWYARLIKET